MRKNKAIKVSESTLKILEEFKINARKSTYEEIILFLLNNKKKEIESVVEFEIQKKTLENIQKKIDLRIESIQKRFSKYADLYFTKIIDNYNFSQQSFKEIIKTISQKEILENSSVNKAEENITNDLIEQKNNEIRILNEQVENNFILVKDLKNDLRALKFIFKEKSKGFSKIYEAVLSVEEYNKYFK